MSFLGSLASGLGGVLSSVGSVVSGVASNFGGDFVKGKMNEYFADRRARDQAGLEYSYAQRFAENSPSWNVKGLRDAGLNPILATSGGFSAPNWKPSSPSPVSTDGGVGVDSFSNILTNLQNRDTSKSQELLNNSSSKVNDANVDYLKAQTATEMLKAEQIKQDLKGNGYKNPVVNDVTRALNNLGGAMNSPTTKDSRSTYIKTDPNYGFMSRYPDSTFFGSIQNSIDEINYLSKETGIRPSRLNGMSKEQLNKIREQVLKKKIRSNKSKGYHFLTR